ncbi:MAG: SWIB/MDM2 domain-containing protein [Bdellovibrionota bacterium]
MPAKKKTTKTKTKRKPNAAFMKPMTPSDFLAKIVGAKPLPRTQVVKKLWQYIKKNKLQDKINRRMIKADEHLKHIFKKPSVSMFEMTKLVSKHLK